jgi:hypothetical protein
MLTEHSRQDTMSGSRGGMEMNVIYVNAEEVVELRSLPPLSGRLVRILWTGLKRPRH